MARMKKTPWKSCNTTCIYVKHRSLLFYLMIILQTVEVVLWQKGAR